MNTTDWKKISIKYLGVVNAKDLDKTSEINCNQRNNNAKKDFRCWSGFNLDSGIQIEVIKMNLLPRLLNLFQSIPNMVPES